MKVSKSNTVINNPNSWSTAINATTISGTLHYSQNRKVKAASKFINCWMRQERWSVTADISQKPH